MIPCLDRTINPPGHSPIHSPLACTYHQCCSYALVTRKANIRLVSIGWGPLTRSFHHRKAERECPQTIVEPFGSCWVANTSIVPYACAKRVPNRFRRMSQCINGCHHWKLTGSPNVFPRNEVNPISTFQLFSPFFAHSGQRRSFTLRSVGYRFRRLRRKFDFLSTRVHMVARPIAHSAEEFPAIEYFAAT
jgi:hypothetical protein